MYRIRLTYSIHTVEKIFLFWILGNLQSDCQAAPLNVHRWQYNVASDADHRAVKRWWCVFCWITGETRLAFVPIWPGLKRDVHSGEWFASHLSEWLKFREVVRACLGAKGSVGKHWNRFVSVFCEMRAKRMHCQFSRIGAMQNLSTKTLLLAELYNFCHKVGMEQDPNADREPGQRENQIPKKSRGKPNTKHKM